MTLGDSELVTGLGLALILALAGSAAAALWWRRAAGRAATAAELNDGAVLIVEDGTVVEASAQAEALFGPAVGRQAREMLGRLFNPEPSPESSGDPGAGSNAAPGVALVALAALEQSGDAINLLTTDAAGRPFEMSGQPRGGQLRLVLREAALLDAELDRARTEIAAREEVVSRRELETRTLAGLLAGAPLAAWNRTPDGRIVWSAGRVPTRHGTVAAAEAAAMAVARANRHDGRSGPAASGAGQAERFRLEITGSGNDAAIALDAIEAAGPDGARLGLAIDASGALGAERTLARFVRTMTETFAHLNVGLAIFDRNQTLALFNPALIDMWQADPAWLARRPSLREIVDSLRASRRIPEMPDFHDWRRRLTDLFDNTETADYEELWSLADGSDIRVVARPHPHGSLAFVFDDVTERMRLEQRFRHSIDLRRATLDRLDEGLAVFGPDGLLHLVNAAFHEIWGTDAETVRPSMHASELLPLVRGLTVETDVWQRLMSFITSADSRQAWGARLTLGTGRILGARFAPLPDGSTMATFADVTDSERIALALRERNEALEAAEEMRAAVLDQVSHRLRTPLNTIFGFGQLIADSRFGELNEAQRGYAQNILESARHLLATIDDVTELAALKIDSLHDHDADLSLGDTLMLTGRLLERRATEEGVELHIVAPQSGCEAVCDAGRLRQIVFNMTTDAISRCNDGGKIELGARAAEGGAVDIYTLETFASGEAADPARTEAVSLTVPFLRRLVAQEGGSFELRAGDGAGTSSAVCRFRGIDTSGETEPG